MHKLTEKQYLENPKKWNIHFVGYDNKNRPYAMAEKVTRKNFKNKKFQSRMVRT